MCKVSRPSMKEEIQEIIREGLHEERLIVPSHVSQRSGIQLFSNQAPVRKELVHQTRKVIVVTSFNQVDHLMHNDIFDALRRFLREFEVQPDSTRFSVTASPSRLHS